MNILMKFLPCDMGGNIHLRWIDWKWIKFNVLVEYDMLVWRLRGRLGLRREE